MASASYRRLGLLRRTLSGTVQDLAPWNQNFESGVLGGTEGVRFVQFEYDKRGTMKTTIFLRIAAVLTLIHSILHTVGGVFGKPLPGAAEQAVATLLDVSGQGLSAEDFDRLAALVAKAKKEGR